MRPSGRRSSALCRPPGELQGQGLEDEAQGVGAGDKGRGRRKGKVQRGGKEEEENSMERRGGRRREKKRKGKWSPQKKNPGVGVP